MTGKLIELLSVFIVATISRLGYAGVVLLMAIESACIPLPSEIIMPFSGYLVYTGRFNLWAVGGAGAVRGLEWVVEAGREVVYCVRYVRVQYFRSHVCVSAPVRVSARRSRC